MRHLYPPTFRVVHWGADSQAPTRDRSRAGRMGNDAAACEVLEVDLAVILALPDGSMPSCSLTLMQTIPLSLASCMRYGEFTE